MEIIGLFGGTFNPIHQGHLALADSVYQTLGCTQIRFIPAAVPPHKEAPAVTAHHRATMVQLAIQSTPQYVLDACELDRQGPSYTIETLHLLRQQFPQHALCLIMGQDSYQQLPTWRRWQALLGYAHVLVVHRAAHDAQLFLHAAHAGKQVDISAAKHAFAQHSHGLISFLPLPPPGISSTLIRQRLAQAPLSAAPDLPPAVWQYIQQHHLYQTN